MAQRDETLKETPKEASTRRSRRAVAPAGDPQTRQEQPQAAPDLVGMSPEALARALRAVAAELERDPALARRVASAIGAEQGSAPEASEALEPPEIPSAPVRSGHDAERDSARPATIGRGFRPTIVTGVAPDLGAGVPDPFALRARLGADGLRQALESLRLGSLRAIVREHKLDPSGRLNGLNDAAKLRERIIQATARRS